MQHAETRPCRSFSDSCLVLVVWSLLLIHFFISTFLLSIIPFMAVLVAMKVLGAFPLYTSNSLSHFFFPVSLLFSYLLYFFFSTSSSSFTSFFYNLFFPSFSYISSSFFFFFSSPSFTPSHLCRQLLGVGEGDGGVGNGESGDVEVTHAPPEEQAQYPHAQACVLLLQGRPHRRHQGVRAVMSVRFFVYVATYFVHFITTCLHVTTTFLYIRKTCKPQIKKHISYLCR